MHRSFASLKMTTQTYVANLRDTTLATTFWQEGPLERAAFLFGAWLRALRGFRRLPGPRRPPRPRHLPDSRISCENELAGAQGSLLEIRGIGGKDLPARHLLPQHFPAQHLLAQCVLSQDVDGSHVGEPAADSGGAPRWWRARRRCRPSGRVCRGG